MAARRGGALYLQVLVAIACGILLGVVRPEWGIALKPLGDGFVRLIKLLIGPLIFSTVVIGIAGMGDLRKVGRVGAKALVWFEVMTTIALALGLLVVSIIGPGRGLHVNAASLDTTELNKTLAAAKPESFVGHVLAMIPETFVGAFTSGDALQVLVIAILTGLALASMKERGKAILHGLEHVAALSFAIVGVVMRLAPIGAFGAMAFTIGKHGLGTLANLAMLIISFYVTSLLFVFVVLGTALRVVGINVFQFVRHLKEELLLVLGTSSSESALPMLMEKLEKLGCAPSVVRLVVPTGYSFNLDGTCIYLTMASVFVAQALDVPLSLGQEFALLGVLLLTSKGAAGVTGSGFVTLSATLNTVGSIPVSGLSLLLGIDRFMSEARALTNLVGNAVATVIVARWEGALDVTLARETLSRKSQSVEE